MSMHIDETIRNFLETELGNIGSANLPSHVSPCPHCGVPVRYPTVARSQDIEDFAFLMEAAARVMKKHNITANLLADIHTDIQLSLAAQRVARNLKP